MTTLNNTFYGYYKYFSGASTEGEDFDDETIQGLLNDTDSELSGLSHLDAPNESLYMIGGVLIAMFLVGVIIILLAVTISKLRKREEHSNSVHPAESGVVLETTPSPATTNLSIIQPQTNSEPQPYRGPFLWPPPPPPCLYNNNQELVQSIPTERPGFVRGFRKNLGGHWRRLVKRKPETDDCRIPAELKPQLKQIYVY